jgi:hypothetical protein
MSVSNECTYDDCAKDEDCAHADPFAPKGSRGVCLCAGDDWTPNACVFGDCLDDRDCPRSGRCSLSRRPDGCGQVLGYFCRGDDDACHTDADCADAGRRGSSGAPFCAYDADNDAGKGRWRCMKAPNCGMR